MTNKIVYIFVYDISIINTRKQVSKLITFLPPNV